MGILVHKGVIHWLPIDCYGSYKAVQARQGFAGGPGALPKKRSSSGAGLRAVGCLQFHSLYIFLPRGFMGVPSIEEAVRTRLAMYLKELHGTSPDGVYDMVIRAVERPVIEMMVEHAGGNQALAAEYLGISRLTLRKKLAQV